MKIESFEQANEKRIARGLQPVVMPDLSGFPEGLKKSTEANIKLDVIAEEMREGKPIKTGWFPVFTNEKHSSGFGFSHSCTTDWDTDTGVGARREFFTESDSDHFGTAFIDLHRDSKLVFNIEEVDNEKN